MKDTWPRAAAAIAAGASENEAGRVAGVTGRTVSRWRNDEVQFTDAVDAARTEYLNETAGLLAHISTAAVRKLGEIIEDGSERYALAAARTVLDMASRYRNAQALEGRLTALELASGLRR
jgi:hypothetical protein